VIEAITASRRSVTNVSSPNRSGWEIGDSAARMVAAMTERAAVCADMRSWPPAARGPFAV